MVDSVVALVGGRDCHGEHLPLHPRKLRRAVHDHTVEAPVDSEGFGVETVDLEDVVDRPAWVRHFVVHLPQLGRQRGRVFIDDFDPGLVGHGVSVECVFKHIATDACRQARKTHDQLSR